MNYNMRILLVVVFIGIGTSSYAKYFVRRTHTISADAYKADSKQKVVEEDFYSSKQKGLESKKNPSFQQTIKRVANNCAKVIVPKGILKHSEVKKEMDPRLSRALWMTIFGGIATTLGIVFNSVAPTGLFVFAFGIVFIIGVVSLIMYLANPKPKM